MGALIEPNQDYDGSISGISRFGQSDFNNWGPVGPLFYSSGTQVIDIKNTEPLLEPNSQDESILPCRLYKGREDIEIVIKFNQLLKIAVEMEPMLAQGDGRCYAFVQTLNESGATIKLRVIDPGWYSLVIYGWDLFDQSDYLQPIYCSLIQAEAASDCTCDFPQTFGLWSNIGHSLLSPQSRFLKRGEPNEIKILLNKFVQGSGKNKSCIAFPKVALFVDGKTLVEPDRITGGFCYEWNYVPGRPDKLVAVIARKEEQDKGMSMLLQFEVK